jgi:hypothetical protein
MLGSNVYSACHNVYSITRSLRLQRCPSYEEEIEDVHVERGGHAVHTAMLVRAPHPTSHTGSGDRGGGGGSGVIVKAMRGWDTPAAMFSADDASMLRHFATAAAQVCFSVLQKSCTFGKYAGN